MDSNHLQKQVVAEQKRKVAEYDYRRAGYGHSTGGVVPDYQGFCPPAVNFFGDRPDCQHFPDHYIHSGADADVCAEDTLVFIGMMLLGGWMLENLTSFITDLWSDFGVYLR